MRDSFKKNLEWIPHLIMFVTFFGFAILHLQSAGSLLGRCLQENASIPGWCSTNRWFVIGVPACVIGIPLILLRSIRGFSHVSMATCVLIVLYIVHSAVYLGIYTHRDGFDPHQHLKFVNEDVHFFIESLSIQAFAYACHPLIGPTLERLVQPSRERQYNTMALVTICATLCYTLGGLLPYLTLFDRVCDPVVFIYYLRGQVFTIIAEATYAVFLIITSPLILYSARLALNDFFFRTEFTDLRWRLIGVCVILGATIVAITVRSISTVFGFVGGVSCNLVVYILPAIYYLRICRGHSQTKTRIAWAMIPVGSLSICVCLYQAIYGIIHPVHCPV
jgi:amino acid permease